MMSWVVRIGGALRGSIAFLLWLALCSSAAHGQSKAETFRTGSAPEWVEWVGAEAKNPSADQEPDGQIYTLIDTQVNPAKGERYIHVVKEIANQNGVQDGSNLSFSWDPSCEELEIHQLTIERDGNRLDKLDPAKFKVLHQESDLDRQIYNGELSAVVFLEDVRAGDRIEYSWTVRGENPSLKGHCSETYSLSSSARVHRRRLRFVCPKSGRFFYEVWGADLNPEKSKTALGEEFIWDLKDQAGIIYEDQTPSWFPTYPWVTFSDFKSWGELADWAVAFYGTTLTDERAMQEEIERLRKPGISPEQMVQDALDFVQNNIRYLGIEFGPHSYHPTDPATVLQRRFGDCKDKAFLLSKLLQAMGFDAAPALVGTEIGHNLSRMIPAPADFNHVIVRVVANGKAYWIDPTRSNQRGPLGDRYLPNYCYALLVRAGETGVTEIPYTGAGGPASERYEYFTVQGQDQPATLRVTNVFFGLSADYMRAFLNSGGRERFEKALLGDYSQVYPRIVSTAPVIVEEAAGRDKMTLVQSYSIGKFWKPSEDGKRYSCLFMPPGIRTWIAKPDTTIRKMPMELAFPRQTTVRTHVDLPVEMQLTPESRTITTPGASFRVERKVTPGTVDLLCEYRSLTNFVPVELTEEHIRKLDEMDDSLGYSLTWQSQEALDAENEYNWPIIATSLLYGVALVAGIGFIYRWQRKAARMATGGGMPPVLAMIRLNGLGGWLILVGMGIIARTIILAVSLTNSMLTLAPDQWYVLTNPAGVSYKPLWAPTLIGELLWSMTLLALSIFQIYLFFRKRRQFPKWFIWTLLASVVFAVADGWAVSHLKAPTTADKHALVTGFVSLMLVCLIWIPYMLVSERVRNTFVR